MVWLLWMLRSDSFTEANHQCKYILPEWEQLLKLCNKGNLNVGYWIKKFSRLQACNHCYIRVKSAVHLGDGTSMKSKSKTLVMYSVLLSHNQRDTRHPFIVQKKLVLSCVMYCLSANGLGFCMVSRTSLDRTSSVFISISLMTLIYEVNF